MDEIQAARERVLRGVLHPMELKKAMSHEMAAGALTWFGVAVMPWEGGPALLLSFLSAAVASGLAYLLLRWGNRQARGVVVGYSEGAAVGLFLATALLWFHPYWSVDQTRPQDAILGGLILGAGSVGAVVGALKGEMKEVESLFS